MEWGGVGWSGEEYKKVREEWSGVEWSGVERSGVEWSGVESSSAGDGGGEGGGGDAGGEVGGGRGWEAELPGANAACKPPAAGEGWEQRDGMGSGAAWRECSLQASRGEGGGGDAGREVGGGGVGGGGEEGGGRGGRFQGGGWVKSSSESDWLDGRVVVVGRRDWAASVVAVREVALAAVRAAAASVVAVREVAMAAVTVVVVGAVAEGGGVDGWTRWERERARGSSARAASRACWSAVAVAWGESWRTVAWWRVVGGSTRNVSPLRMPSTRLSWRWMNLAASKWRLWRRARHALAVVRLPSNVPRAARTTALTWTRAVQAGSLQRVMRRLRLVTLAAVLAERPRPMPCSQAERVPGLPRAASGLPRRGQSVGGGAGAEARVAMRCRAEMTALVQSAAAEGSPPNGS